jgi:hypothetical protein
MPYIKKEQRVELDKEIEALIAKLQKNQDVGEYNYSISRLIHAYVLKEGLRYKNLNAACGILKCATEEFIRTVVSPYEDEKIISNGSVSELDDKNGG